MHTLIGTRTKFQKKKKTFTILLEYCICDHMDRQIEGLWIWYSSSCVGMFLQPGWDLTVYHSHWICMYTFQSTTCAALRSSNISRFTCVISHIHGICLYGKFEYKISETRARYFRFFSTVNRVNLDRGNQVSIIQKLQFAIWFGGR